MARLQAGPRVIAQTPVVSDIRELSRADLAHLAKPRPPTQLQSLRDSHHRIARAVASGLPNGEVASLCGISVNRVTQLLADPSFTELVAHYRGLVTAEWVRQQDHLFEMATANMRKAEQMLSDKIDDAIAKDEFLPTRDLIAITGDRMDRFGYGKHTTSTNFNVDFAARLESARKRSASARVIEGQASPPLAPQSASAGTSSPTSPQHPPGPSTLRRV